MQECITPVLQLLHRLPVLLQIDFKVLLLVFKCFNDRGPSYLSDLLLPYQIIVCVGLNVWVCVYEYLWVGACVCVCDCGCNCKKYLFVLLTQNEKCHMNKLDLTLWKHLYFI